MKKINVAELLKNCPTDMELDSPMYDNLYFGRVEEDHGLLILCYTIYHGNKTAVYFTEFGSYNTHKTAKCVIFPKGKTTWEGFHRPFEDGDIIYTKHKLGTEFISIFQIEYERDICTYWDINLSTNKLIGNLHEGNAFKVFIEKDKVKEQRFATEEEKERLFRAIKDNGYQWNTETKTLKKLLKFKVGDRVRIKSIDWYNENKDEFDQVKCGNQIFTYPMTKLCSKTVTIRCVNAKDCYYVLYEDGGYRSWTDEMVECKVEEENKPKFKDGDVLYIHSTSAWICIYNEGGEIANVYYKYVAMSSSTFTHDDAPLCCRDHVKEIRLATEEEKEKLFKAIKDNGYQWNTETKTLEKLPKFKVGDKIRNVIVNLGIHTVLNVDTSGYAVKKDDQYGNFRVNFDGEKNWELVPDVKPFDKVGDRIKSVMSSSNKFDIKTLKPFDKVLMRPSNAREWVATFYSHYSNNKFYGCGMCCSQCIPYEGNEHLLGKTDDCSDYYKTWE